MFADDDVRPVRGVVLVVADLVFAVRVALDWCEGAPEDVRETLEAALAAAVGA